MLPQVTRGIPTLRVPPPQEALLAWCGAMSGRSAASPGLLPPSLSLSLLPPHLSLLYLSIPPSCLAIFACCFPLVCVTLASCSVRAHALSLLCALSLDPRPPTSCGYCSGAEWPVVWFVSTVPWLQIVLQSSLTFSVCWAHS